MGLTYGIARGLPHLPPLDDQRARLLALGCDVILEERDDGHAAQRAIRGVVQNVRKGDDLLIWDLSALRFSTGELVGVIHRFRGEGARLRIVGNAADHDLTATSELEITLGLLADHERARPSRAAPRTRPSAPSRGLTRHQRRYAQELRRRGESLRAIGLLFQMTPEELRGALREPFEPA